MGQDKTRKSEEAKAPIMDDILRRMLATPPDPHKKPVSKPPSKANKKPAK
jgi:hypothetical protein